MLEHILKEYLAGREGAYLSISAHLHEMKPEDDRKFRMSDAGKCRLFRYWKRQGKEIPTPSFENMMNMEAGNILHAYISNAIEEAGFIIESEGCLEDEHRIGHFDLLFEHPVDKGMVLADVKSVSSKKMFYLKKNGRVTPDMHHVFQLLTYYKAIIDGLGDPILDDGETIDRTVIFYVNRDNWSEIVECEVDHTVTGYLPAVNQDWSVLAHLWNTNQQPAANPTEKWECQYCPYAKECLEIPC